MSRFLLKLIFRSLRKVAGNIIDCLNSGFRSIGKAPHIRRLIMVGSLWIIGVGAWGQITNIFVSPLSICQGGIVDVSFDAGLYNPGNIFTIYLTDEVGSFSIPIGTRPSQGSGHIVITTNNITTPGGIGGSNFKIRVESSNLPSTSEDYQVTIYNRLVPTVITHPVLCFGGTNGSIELTIAGGTDPYLYSSDGSTWLSSGTFSDLSAGTYTVTVIDAIGCTTTATSLVTQPSHPLSISVHPLDQTDCKGNLTEFIVIPSGGVGTTQFQWQRDSGSGFTDIPGETHSQFNLYEIGVGSDNENGNLYRVRITDDCHTIYSNSATLGVNEIIGVTQGRNSTICSGGSITYSVTTSNPSLVQGFQWLRQEGANWNPIIEGGGYSGTTTFQLSISNASASQSGSYRVSVTFATINQPPSNPSCTERSSSRERNLLVRDPVLPPAITPSQSICYNTIPAQLTAAPASGGSGSFNYQWQSSPDGSTDWTNIPATSLSYSPAALTSTTYYQIIATDIGNPSCGAVVSLPTVITVNPLPVTSQIYHR